VFCRNVLIYIRTEETLAFLDRVARCLAPDGWLFLGYSESLWPVTDQFQMVRVGEAFAYRRREGGREAPAPEVTEARSGDRRRVGPRRPPHRGAAPAGDLGTPADRGAPPGSAASVVELLAAGEAAMNAGNHAAAVSAFRKCAFLAPDHAVSHFRLGVALEAAGEPGAARRAFAAARDGLRRRGPTEDEATLEGYHAGELVGCSTPSWRRRARGTDDQRRPLPHR
jgi:chemotaxis protein methyltransferase CheR